MKKVLIRLLALTMTLLLLTSQALAVEEGFVVRNGDRESNRIAVTVDDCYDENVLRMMYEEIMLEYNVPLTFFVIGTQIRDTDKEVWEGIIANGGEVGNHTWKHPRLPDISIHNARNQILLTQEAFDKLLGYHYPLRLLRPPYGSYKNEKVNLLNMFEEYGVEKCVLWDVSNIDPVQARKEVKNGSIMLYHTNYADLNCLKELIPQLMEDGYELVTVSELLGMEPLQTSEELYVFPYR